MSNLKIFFKAILIPVLVGVIVGLVTSNFMDYEMLNKPFLSPPGFLLSQPPLSQHLQPPAPLPPQQSVLLPERRKNRI